MLFLIRIFWSSFFIKAVSFVFFFISLTKKKFLMLFIVQISLYVRRILNSKYTKDIRISLIGKALCYGHKD